MIRCVRFTATKMYVCARLKRELLFCNANCNAPMDKVTQIWMEKISMQAIHTQLYGSSPS